MKSYIFLFFALSFISLSGFGKGLEPNQMAPIVPNCIREAIPSSGSEIIYCAPSEGGTAASCGTFGVHGEELCERELDLVQQYLDTVNSQNASHCQSVGGYPRCRVRCSNGECQSAAYSE